MKRHNGGNFGLGIIVLLAGVFFLLANTPFFKGFGIKEWWPAILIAVGLLQWIGARSIFHFSGWLLIVLGLVFLAVENNKYGLTWDNFWKLWPVLLVLIGLSMLFGRRGVGCACAGAGVQTNETELRERVVLGGIEKEVASDDFRGGEIESILGSVELDLRGAKMKADQAVLRISSVLGNVELRVPSDWQVEVQSRSALGSVENKCSAPAVPAGTKAKKLLLDAHTVLGNIEVDN